jgi:hypothetical protein
LENLTNIIHHFIFLYMKLIFTFLLAVCLTQFNTALYSQACIPAAAATVAGMVPGTSGNYTFMNVPTGRVIQLTADQANTSYLIDMCGTNAGNNVPSGTNDCFLSILSANGPAATPLLTLDDGCPNMAAPGYGPAVGTWVAPAAGTYYIYLTEYNAAGSNNCISNGNNSNYDFSITVTAPPSYDAAIIYDNVEYTAIPRYQISGGGLSLGGVVTNLGASAFTGVTVTASVATAADPGTSIFSVTGSPAALGIGQTNTVIAGNWVPPAGNGDYIITYSSTTVPADASTTNNTWVRNLSLTGDFYARDNGSVDGGLGIAAQGTIIQGAQYTFLQTGQIKEVNTVFLGGGVGDTVQLEIYTITANSPSASPVASSGFVVLTAAGSGDFTFTTSSPFTPTAGTTYLFAVKHFSRGVNIAMGYSDNLFIPGRNWINFSGTWAHPEEFNFNAAYIIRPVFQVCTEPEITIGTYNCANNSISVTVGNAGSPTTGSSFSLQLNGDTNGSIPFSSSGVYTFNGLSPDQSYFVVATDGNGSCDVFSDDIFTNDCFVLGQGCNDILVDGGFEQASGTVWAETFTDLLGTDLGFPVVDPNIPQTGLQSAWFGGNGTDGSISSLSQNINIPASASSAEFSFWGLALDCTNLSDNLAVKIDGITIATILTSDNGFCDDALWHRYSVDLSGVSSGNHTLNLTFTQNGVSGNANFFVDEARLEVCACATIAINTSTTPSACGLSIGTATATPSGGSGPYAYLWSNNQTTATATQLAVGQYTVTVTDNAGCTSTATVTIGSSNGPTATASTNNISCFGGNNGSIDLTVSGGTAPYTYDWSNDGPENPDNDLQDIAGLAAGMYTCTITDFSGCTFITTASLTQPIAVSGTTSVDNVSCFGVGDGSVDLNPNGGTPGYTYMWNNGMTTQDISGLVPGPYTVTMTDANGCTGTTMAMITQPLPLILGGLPTINDASCNGSCDGTVTNVVVTGGTTPYSYNWSNGGNAANIGNLCAGDYSGTVTDNNGCTFSASVTINEPSAISLGGFPTITNASCADACDGSVSNVVIIGGTPPYSYDWSNGGGTANLENLCAGNYTGTVTDGNGCVYTTPIPLTITSPPAIVISGNVTNSTIDNNGAIDITVSGGTGAYSYNWSNGMTSQDISSLEPGVYSVIVTDANGCSLPQLFEVVLLVSNDDIPNLETFSTQPNPTNGLIWSDIRLKEASDITVELLNITGQILSSSSSVNSIGDRFIFDLEKYADGIYFIRLTVNSGSMVQKVVLSK